LQEVRRYMQKNKEKFDLSQSERLAISKFCEEDIALYNDIKRTI